MLPPSPSYLACTDYAGSPVHRRRLEFILTGIPSAPSSVLDVGCGIGNIAMPIASFGHRVLGIDIHEGSVQVARGRNRFPNLTFGVQDLDQAAVGEFDVIVLSEVLEHVSDYSGMFHSIASRMHPGARLILTVPNGYSAAELMCRPSYWLKRRKGGERVVHFIKRLLGSHDLTTANTQTPHVQFFTRRRLFPLFRENGLEVVSEEKGFFLWPVYETLFGSRRWAAVAGADLRLSGTLPASLCSYWGWVLQRM